MTCQGGGLALDAKQEICGHRRRRKPDAGPSKTAGAVAAAVTTGTEARLAWIRRRCRYRPLNPGVRMHERDCVDGCRPSRIIAAPRDWKRPPPGTHTGVPHLNGLMGTMDRSPEETARGNSNTER